MSQGIFAAPDAAHPRAADPAWWTSDLVVAAALAAVVALYVYGAVRTWRHAGPLRGLQPWQAAAFGAGIAVLGVALLSPFDRAGEVLLSAHLGRHELMMLVAAPLIVLGRPGVPVLRALPRRWRGRARRAARRPGMERAWRILTAPVVALAIHLAARGLWQLPGASGAALADERIHAAQHLTLFATAVLCWWALIHGRHGALGRAAHPGQIAQESLWRGHR